MIFSLAIVGVACVPQWRRRAVRIPRNPPQEWPRGNAW
jgi:hypothetical protein